MLLFLAYFILVTIIFFKNFAFSQQQNPTKTLKPDSLLIQKKEKNNLTFNGNDGPYIINNTLLYRVNEKNELKASSNFNRDSILVNVDNNDKNIFYVSLASKYEVPKTYYPASEKIMVISDIEGNYDAFVSFLFTNQVIDKNHNWIYGNGDLVLNGDFVDRGKNVTQVLWLIYKLDQQAKKHNGNVHFIIGNHEIINFYGDYRYNRNKYIKAAQSISKLDNKKSALRFLYSKHSEIGKWLSTKNVIEKIGNYIFAHAGLSPDILKYNLSLQDINDLVRSKYYRINNAELRNNTLQFLYGSKGPFWYRGLARKELDSKQLTSILNRFNSKKIIIGHTPVNKVTSSFNGRVINTDIRHGTEKFSGETFGLLIENNQEFIIDDTCSKTLIKD